MQRNALVSCTVNMTACALMVASQMQSGIVRVYKELE